MNKQEILDRLNELKKECAEENRIISSLSEKNFYRFVNMMSQTPLITLAEWDNNEDSIYAVWHDEKGDKMSINFTAGGKIAIVGFKDYKLIGQVNII